MSLDELEYPPKNYIVTLTDGASYYEVYLRDTIIIPNNPCKLDYLMERFAIVFNRLDEIGCIYRFEKLGAGAADYEMYVYKIKPNPQYIKFYILNHHFLKARDSMKEYEMSIEFIDYDYSDPSRWECNVKEIRP
jgi:hypothetical protein